ncbi:uncharacterized protein LOC134811986 [Bolinopsis microptera]|uniref:uncharacterized protein LOC134811986 n=1 Tax=Bolinopsis microptera TaxID=2820187 RepID=UPI0030799A57
MDRKKMKVRTDYIFRGFIKDFGDKPEGIHVDWFDFTSVKNLYFLSHAHSDHFTFEHSSNYIGLLTKKFIEQLKKKSHIKIYCTTTTWEIIIRLPKAKAVVEELDKLKEKNFVLVEPDIENPITIELLNKKGTKTGQTIDVTVIPANHIPGAVMFLFEDLKNKKRALYTGDFRYDVRENNIEMRDLEKFVKNLKANARIIDYLYVDITYLDIGRLYHPDQNKLPTRQESKDAVFDLIRRQNPKSVHIDAELLGAEDMVKAVAESFNNTADDIISRLDKDCSRRQLYEYTLQGINIPCVGTTIETDVHIYDNAIFDDESPACGKMNEKFQVTVNNFNNCEEIRFQIPYYTGSNDPVEAENRIIIETLKNLQRNRDKFLLAKDWPMPYEFSERKREYEQDHQKEPASQEVGMVDTEEIGEMGETEPMFQGLIEGFKEKEDAPGGMAVDWFEGKMKNLYFISHAHADHIKGLFSHENEFYKQLKLRPYARIYCTKVTKEIISRLPIAKDNPDVMNELEKHLSILEPNKTKKIYFYLLEKLTQKWIQVRTVTANHIPGAVMFLFEDGKKRTLYTGDFRYDTREKNNEMQALKEFVENYDEVIDYLYVDITCLDLGRLYHPDQNVLPSRLEITDTICRLIKDKKPRDVHIDATPLGAEGMIKEVAKILNSPRDSIIDKPAINDSKRKELYRYMLNDLSNTYSDTSEIGLHIFDKRTPKYKCVLCDEHTLRIRATLKWIVKQPTGKYSHSDRTTWINERDHKNGDYWQVVNSHHSSDHELREFISHLQFKKVFPISEPLSRQYFKGIYYKDVTGPETNSEKKHRQKPVPKHYKKPVPKHRHIEKSLYFSLESASMKYNYVPVNVLWLTENSDPDYGIYMPDDKFHVTKRYFRDYDDILSEVKKYSQPIDFLIIPCTMELQKSLALTKLYYDLSRFIDNLKEAIVTKNKKFDEAISTVLFYSNINDMNDKWNWKQIINSSCLYRDKLIPRVFYVDLTNVPEYTESNSRLVLETLIIFKTLKNLIRNEDKQVFVSDWPMPYEFSERKREYDQENQDRAREPASQEVEMVDTEEVNNNIGEAEETANETLTTALDLSETETTQNPSLHSLTPLLKTSTLPKNIPLQTELYPSLTFSSTLTNPHQSTENPPTPTSTPSTPPAPPTHLRTQSSDH